MGCCIGKKFPDKLISSTRLFSRENSTIKLVIVKHHNLLVDYLILKTIGEGATGQVKLVKHRKTHIERALKTIIIPPGSSVALLMQEVDIMKQLDHPNILRPIEVYQEKYRVHFVMEYCKGGELFENLSKYKSFTEKQAGKYIYDILSALMYMHSRGLVHRDLKPENILFEDISDDSVLKIADFGMAAWLDNVSVFRKNVGTVYYIAPEVLNHSSNEKCDVWSAGVILYMLLGGFPPFRGETEEDTFRQIKTKKPNFSHSIWENISKEAKTLVKRMLKKNPNDRPSASEVFYTRWIQQGGCSDKQDDITNKNCLRNIQVYNIKNKLHRATLAYIAAQMLTHQEEFHAKTLFRELDRDGDGMLSYEELEKGFSMVDLEIDIKELFSSLDADGNGFIDYTEFLVAAINWKRVLSEERLIEAFKMYDQNGDGKISGEGLKLIFKDASGDNEYYRELIREADVDGDGKLSLEDFITFMRQRLFYDDDSVCSPGLINWVN